MRRNLSFSTQRVHLGVAGFLLACVLLWMPEMAWSQANSATYYGSVTDPSGAVVPSAVVTLTNQNTQATLTKSANSSGDFGFTFVPAGVYTLTIDAAGFKAYISNGITLTAGQQVRQTFALELGALTDKVSVEGTAPLVNTVSAQQLQNYSITDARELPLQNRNFSGLLKINAGIVPSQGNNGTGVNMNGVGRNGTVYSLDGTNATGNSGSNNPGVYQGANLVDVLSVEGIQEVSAVKGAIPAEYEDAVGGQVNLVSKSGTNNLHGSLFENHQDSAANARLQVVATKPALTFNQFGGSLGGPIKKNKIFLFGDYEGYRESAASFVQGNVPTALARQQLLSAVPDYQLALQAFPLPSSPTAANALVGNFSATKREIHKDDHYDAKGDVILTANSRLAFTYNHGTPYWLVPRYYNDDNRNFITNLNRFGTSFQTGGSNWTSETRLGYNRTIWDRTDDFFSLKDPASSSESFPYGRRIPDLNTSLGWTGPSGEINHLGGGQWQLSEKYARLIGHHFLKFGADYHLWQGTCNNPQIPDFLYTSFDALLNNQPSQVAATLGSGLYDGRMSEWGLFAQDDWKVSPKLTVNLGLRYDFYSNFVGQGAGGTPQAGLYNPTVLSMDGQFNVGPYRSPSDPYPNDAVNFGPRVGFAYNPDGKGKTAIRAGFGVMFSNLMPENFWNVLSSAPNVPYRATFTPADIKTFAIKYPDYNDNFFKYTQQLTQTSPITYVSAIYSPSLQNPYTMQYTFDIQRQITSTVMFQTAFVGTRGVKFPLWRSANTVDRLTGLRPNPNLGGQPNYVDSSQTMTYYGWQNSIRKRFGHQLSFDVNYTWSKALGNGGGDSGAYYDGENFSRSQSFFDLRADRGPTASDITHYFAADFVYDLPGFSSLGTFARTVLGGWQATGIFSAQTGLPIIVTQTSSTPNQRADYIGGQAILSNYQDTLQYLNPAAFQKIPVSSASGAPIRPGNAGPGEVRSPGLWNLNFSMAKNFSIRENVKLQIRTDMFNTLNHTNLSGLRTSVNDPFFGQLLSTLGARVMQFNARITF
ncbi:MAG: TonB-dependent receptor [Acidobacteriia bacterium]|nr:TonB-dependent receptor [Terriglobia bacterium]